MKQYTVNVSIPDTKYCWTEFPLINTRCQFYDTSYGARQCCLLNVDLNNDNTINNGIIHSLKDNSCPAFKREDK